MLVRLRSGERPTLQHVEAVFGHVGSEAAELFRPALVAGIGQEDSPRVILDVKQIEADEDEPLGLPSDLVGAIIDGGNRRRRSCSLY